MGQKASNFMQSDRPESGGANKDEALEKSGILEREQQRYATSAAEREQAENAEREGKTGLQNGVESPRSSQ